MTQKEQVIDALIKIGGKGTLSEICKAISSLSKWKTKSPEASVASYLSKSDKVTKSGNIWIYKMTTSLKKSKVKSSSNIITSERGLYFITLNPSIGITTLGFLLKVGMTKGLRKRMNDYGLFLPYDPIQLLGFFPIPADVSLSRAEKQVRYKLLENNSSEFHVVTYPSKRQEEWLQVSDLEFTPVNIKRIASVITKIVNDTVDNLRKSSKISSN